jgi:hypothetical protein
VETQDAGRVDAAVWARRQQFLRAASQDDPSARPAAAPSRRSLKSRERIENGSRTSDLLTSRTSCKTFGVLMLHCDKQRLTGFNPCVTSLPHRPFANHRPE